MIEKPLAVSAAQRLPQPEIRTLPDLHVLFARERGMIEYSFSKAADRAFSTLIAYLQYEAYLTDYRTEPRKLLWNVERSIKIADK